MLKPTWRKLLLGLLLPVGFVTLFLFLPERGNLAHLASAVDNYNAEILRDSWGVSHIFGQTDADAAYGLA